MRRGDTSTGSPVSSSTRSQSTSAVFSSHGTRRSVDRSGTHAEVAVALLPVRELGSRAAASCRRRRRAGSCRPRCPSPEHVVEEEVAGDPLAHEPALQVGEHDEHGVDARRCGSALESSGRACRSSSGSSGDSPHPTHADRPSSLGRV